MAKRKRPADGGVVWHEGLNAFECQGCGEYVEIRKRADRTPDRLVELQELMVVDHTECWEYDDPQMARNARRYRKEGKRRQNLAGRRMPGAARKAWLGHGKGGR